jgi:hypothetical protein
MNERHRRDTFIPQYGRHLLCITYDAPNGACDAFVIGIYKRVALTALSACEAKAGKYPRSLAPLGMTAQAD